MHADTSISLLSAEWYTVPVTVTTHEQGDDTSKKDAGRMPRSINHPAIPFVRTVCMTVAVAVAESISLRSRGVAFLHHQHESKSSRALAVKDGRTETGRGTATARLHAAAKAKPKAP